MIMDIPSIMTNLESYYDESRIVKMLMQLGCSILYGNDVRLRIASLGTKEVLTAPHSPW